MDYIQAETLLRQGKKVKCSDWGDKIEHLFPEQLPERVAKDLSVDILPYIKAKVTLKAKDGEGNSYFEKDKSGKYNLIYKYPSWVPTKKDIDSKKWIEV